jgi:hypothetical protein
MVSVLCKYLLDCMVSVFCKCAWAWTTVIVLCFGCKHGHCYYVVMFFCCVLILVTNFHLVMDAVVSRLNTSTHSGCRGVKTYITTLIDRLMKLMVRRGDLQCSVGPKPWWRGTSAVIVFLKWTVIGCHEIFCLSRKICAQMRPGIELQTVRSPWDTHCHVKMWASL